MIGYLKGRVKLIINTALIIDVNNVGYRVEAGNIGAIEGEEVEFFIHTHVREQELTLYGFKKSIDLEIFDLLLTVSGVGPKGALQIVSEKGAEGVISAIAQNNPLILKIKGIGAKTSEKIIIELRGKIDKYNYQDKTDDNNFQFNNSIYIEVVEALTSLGYRKNEIDAVIKQIEWNKEDQTQDLIKKVLNYLKK